MKKIEFLSENFHFLVVKFSIYLNRCVLVMKIRYQTSQITHCESVYNKGVL